MSYFKLAANLIILSFQIQILWPGIQLHKLFHGPLMAMETSPPPHPVSQLGPLTLPQKHSRYPGRCQETWMGTLALGLTARVALASWVTYTPGLRLGS